MATLFDPLKAGDLTLANRIVMAPLTRNRSPNAVAGDLSVTYYRQRATAGLIVTEATAITQQGQGYADVPGLYAPEQLAGWRKVTDAVHEAGGKIVVQLWHVGRISHNSLQPGGGKPVAPSAIRANSKTFLIKPDGTGEFAETSEPRALDRSELPGIVDDFRRAAKAAIELPASTASKSTAPTAIWSTSSCAAGSNHRTDDYGGSIENRARFLFEVVDAVTSAVGAGRTGIRLSPVTPANDSSDPDPQPLFNHVASGLGTPWARLHPRGRGRDRRRARLPAGRPAVRLCLVQSRLSRCRWHRGMAGSTTATTKRSRKQRSLRAAPISSPLASCLSPIPILCAGSGKATSSIRRTKPPSTAAGRKATPTIRRWPEHRR